MTEESIEVKAQSVKWSIVVSIWWAMTWPFAATFFGLGYILNVFKVVVPGGEFLCFLFMIITPLGFLKRALERAYPSFTILIKPE